MNTDRQRTFLWWVASFFLALQRPCSDFTGKQSLGLQIAIRLPHTRQVLRVLYHQNNHHSRNKNMYLQIFIQISTSVQ